jgi:glycerol-3-phosphate cytidylyltransferase-like family protein
MTNLYPTTKFNPFLPIANAREIVKGLEIIPAHWSLTPVQEKSPRRKQWQTEDVIPHSEIAQLILHGDDAISEKSGKPYHRYWSGFGLRLGEASQGLIDIDVDGYSAQKLLERLSKGDLPTTVSSTSGKPGRYHLFYQIPDEYREALKDYSGKKLSEFEDLKTDVNAEGKPTEFLELRYDHLQTVLPPSFHPTTGSNKWINSPETTEVAIAPKWLCEYLISQVNAEKLKVKERTDRAITLKAERKAYSNGSDLVSFLNDEVLSSLSLDQIFNWQGHDFRQFGSTLKGNPPWRESASGTSFHVWIDNQGLPAWQDKGTGEGGNAAQYRHRLNGGVGTPKGKDFVDIVKQLTDEAGLQLPKFESKGFAKPTLKAETVDGITKVEHPDQNPEYVYSTDKGIDFKSPIPVDPKKLPKWAASRKLTANLVIKSDFIDFKLFEQKDGKIYVIVGDEGKGKSLAARENKLERQVLDDILSATVTFRRKLVSQEIAEMEKMGLVVDNFSKFDRSTTIPENTHLAGCTESLPKIEGSGYKYDFYSDEFSAIIRQSVSGGTVKGAERAKLQEIFGCELRAAIRVYIMDADMADHDIEMLKKLAPNKEVVVIKFETPIRQRSFKFLDGINFTKDGEIDIKKANQSALLNLLIDPNCKPFIVTDTQGTKIEKLLNIHSKVGFLINSETSANYPLPSGSYCEGETWKHLFDRIPLAKERYENVISVDRLYTSWVGEMMKDPAEFIKNYKPDFVLGSPSIMAGFSVVLQKYFSCIAGIFCGVLRTQGLSQILFRLRDNEIPTYISIPEKGLFSEKDDYYDDDLGKLINERRSELAAEFGNESAVDIILNAQKRINPIWESRSLLEKGLEHFEKSHYRSCLRYALEQKGHTVEFVTSITRGDLTQNMKDIAVEEKIQKASEIFDANEYLDGLEEAKQVHERLETVGTARALTKARILDRLPGIKDTSIWTEDFILECVLKNKNFIKQQETFYFVYNPDMSKKRLETALYNTATAEFVDGESLIQKDYHVIKALQALEIPDFIKHLENGLEISKKSPEVLKIITKARKDTKIHKLAGLIPDNKTVEQKENLKFIKQLLNLVGVFLKDNGQTNTKDGKYHIYGLDFEKFNSDYRKVALDCVNIRWNTWEAEKYQAEKPNWEYTAETGQRAPITLSMPDIELACDTTSLEPVTALATSQETAIESLPAMEHNIMDKVKEMALFGFTPAIKAIARQIKEFGQASEKALATLTEIELLALQEAVLEM